jgi:cytohesin
MATTRLGWVWALTSALLLHVAGTTALAGSNPPLRVSIVADKDAAGRPMIRHDSHFDVHVTNQSDKPIRIWSEWWVPALNALHFRITEKDGKPWMMQRTRVDHADEYLPKTVSIAVGATYVWRVEPTQFFYGERAWTPMLEPNSGEDVTIVPIFEIKADAQGKKQGVWIGRVEGEPVTVRVVNPNYTTPHDYLWNQCPKQALKIMKADPRWINKQDPKDRCTPLHHASRFGFVEVIEWLLANGADVDARAYNDFSPLYFADKPAVVQAILRHRPKDRERAAEFFRQPLQHAAAGVTSGGPGAKKWREIVQLMVDAGAPYTLEIAAYLNDLPRIREALQKDPRLATSADGARSLRVAAAEGHTKICKVLLAHKADPNDWANGTGYPILVPAIRHPAVVKLLLEAGADIKTRISWRAPKTGGWIIDDEATALHFAAKDGAVESTKLLLDAGVDINARDTRGQTALDIAVRCKQGEVAHLVASRMGTAEAPNKGWRTLFHQLVLTGKWDRLGEVLRDKDVADLFAREGPTLMTAAAYQIRVAQTRKHEEDNARYLTIIKTLHERGIPINLVAAITIDDVARVKELLKAEPALASSMDEGKTPLIHRAVMFDRRAIVDLLLGAGADANDADASGYTALHWAAFWGRPEIAKRLLQRGAKVNARASGGFTPLHEAARLGSVAVARELLAAGADVNAVDSRGRTPLSCVGAHGERAEMIELLTRKGGKE